MELIVEQNGIEIVNNLQEIEVLPVVSQLGGMNAIDYDYLYAHTHNTLYFTKDEITTLLSGKAAVSHSHSISDITNLQSFLDSKANLIATNEALALKANISALSNYRLKATAIDYSELSNRPINLTDLAQTSQSVHVSLSKYNEFNNKSSFTPTTSGAGTKYLNDAGNYTTPNATLDHTQLVNRDVANQHAISAITGLQTALDAKASSSSIPTKTSQLTNDSGFINDISNKVDKITGKGLSTNDYTSTEKTKLAGIADNANFYIHPSTHYPSIILQDSNNRFVSDIEKNTWNNKASLPIDYATQITNRPSIPTKISELEKDINFDERYYTESETNTLLSTKQDTLDSSNLKTINGNSLLGTGNLIISGGTGSGHTIQNNGTSLTARTNLDFTGNYTPLKDSSTADKTLVPLTSNLPKDAYINQNVYPALEWIWYHTDGYWYMVYVALNTASSYVGSTNSKIIITKTNNWINFSEVCNYSNTAISITTPKIALDSNGNILVIFQSTTTANRLSSIFFNASNSYAATYSVSISQNTTYDIETTFSLQVSADNRFGVAFFQKHSGSTSYSQLMYVERSAGVNGTWGSVEILGSTPLRAATTTSAAVPQLFFASTNEPIIIFMNNASATSSKTAIAKKVSGTWTIYSSSATELSNSVLYSNNDLIFNSPTNGNCYKYTYSDNNFSNFSPSCSGLLAINSNNDVFIGKLGGATGVAPNLNNLYYYKNDVNTFHRAIRPYFQIGAVISANAYSSFGIYTVIPYSRQRLANAYHLVIRTDGYIYMEII